MLIKPARWALKDGLVDPSWLSLRSSLVVDIPFWENGGLPYDLVSKNPAVLTNGTPAWIGTTRGIGKEFVNDEAIHWVADDYNTAPSTAITLYTMFRSKGPNEQTAEIFGKRYATGSPFWSYSINQDFTTLNIMQGILTISSINRTTSNSIALPSDRFIHCFLFWESGSDITFECRESTGEVVDTRTHGTARSGTISYGTGADNDFKVNHGTTGDTNNATQDQSIIRVATRVWTPEERRRVAMDPFGMITPIWMTGGDQPLYVATAATLSALDAAHAHAVDPTSLSQIHDLLPAGALHGHAVDASSFTQAHVLTLADALQAHTADASGFTQVHILLTNEAAQAHTTATTSFVQNHVFVTADALHGHTANATSLLLADILAADDAAHVHIVDTTAFSQVHDLLVADAAQAQAADTTSFTQVQVLSLADALHAHAADNTILTQPGAATGTDRIIEVKAQDRSIKGEAQDRTIIVAAQNRTIQ